MSEILARIQAKRAALAGAGTDPIQGQANPGGPSAFPEQSARMAAIQRRKAELQAEMDRSASEYQAETANNWQFPDQAAPAQAGLPAMMPGRATSPEMRPQAPPPSATGAPPIPSPVGMPMSLGQYGIEATRNLPGSLESLGQGLWDAAQDPVGTMQGAGQTVLGGAQLAKDYVGVPSNEMLGDFRPQARAAGEHFERYGPDRITDTFRRDPAGTALDVGGLAVPGAAAGARAATMGGRFARNIADIDPPAPRPAPQPRAKTPSRRDFIEGAPSTAQLKAAGGALFEAAENAGVRFPSSTYTPAVDKLSTKLMREGLDPVLHPKVARVHQIMNETVDRNPSLTDLMILRKQYGAAAKSLDADERRLASIAIDRLDDFVESGDAAASGTLREGRQIWARMRKSEIIEKAMERAADAQSGLESGLRNEFRGLHRAIINGRKDMRGFSAAEKAAIRDVARGTATTNTLRRLGALGGGIGTSRQSLNAVLGGGLGFGMGTAVGGPLIGGPIGAALVTGGGNLAARQAQKLTQRRADMARAIAARGETPTKASLAEMTAATMK